MTQVPAVRPSRAVKAPRVAEAVLSNGLRVLVVRKVTVPRVEIRLLAPLGAVRNLAVERVLAKTLTSGTGSRTSNDIAQDLQRFGANLGTNVGGDHFQVAGSVLTSSLGGFLDLVADVLTDANFPTDEVSLERSRVVQELEISRSQPQVVATEALRRRLFGRHRYGTVLPEPGAVSRVGRTSIKRLHDQSIGPKGGVVVVVGDVQPQKAIDLLDATIGRWRGRVTADRTPPPEVAKLGPALFVDRPGSVQTSFKIAGPIPKVGSDDSYAVDIANTIFGGYFVSRWVDNIRERHGYTYSPHSQLMHHQLASYIEISADVGADVTTPALVETLYELGRMCSTDVEADELESARRYRVGVQALRNQSQAGLASTLAGLVTHGLGVDYLKEYPKRVFALTPSDIREASASYLAPTRLSTVLVGDASRAALGVRAVTDVLVESTSVDSGTR